MNHVDASEYMGAAAGSDFGFGGKEKRGGVGGRASKSHNAKEMKVANRRRNEKREREEKKQQDQAQAAWVAAETERWQPVDKADQRH